VPSGPLEQAVREATRAATPISEAQRDGRVLALLQQLGEAEVEQLEPLPPLRAALQEQIAGLHVPVHQPVLVHIGEPLEQLQQQVAGEFGRQRPALQPRR